MIARGDLTLENNKKVSLWWKNLVILGEVRWEVGDELQDIFVSDRCLD
jgi:hypothetical protein